MSVLRVGYGLYCLSMEPNFGKSLQIKKQIYQIISKRNPMEDWSRDFRYCISCHSAKRTHAVAGYCIKCYNEIEVTEDTPLEPIARTCLKCEETFFSKSKWVRKCVKCSRSDSKISGRHRHKFLTGDKTAGGNE